MLAASIIFSPATKTVTVSNTPDQISEVPAKPVETTPSLTQETPEIAKNQQSSASEKKPAESAERQDQAQIKPEQKTEVKPESKSEQKSEPKTEQKPAAKPAPKYAAGKGPKVAIILDDGGHNLSQLQNFLNIPFPLTVAVLPQLSHSAEAAKRVRAAGKGIMLHQPMQAVNLSTDPGPGAITPDMDPQVAAFTMLQNITEIGPVDGVNNHEGSLITIDENIMRSVMLLCEDNGIFFLDSRTNSESVCRSVAKELGMKLYERDIFLDNEKDAASMTSYFKKGLELADKKGSVVMIGHVWSSSTLAGVLSEQMALAAEQGYQFTTVDKL